MPRLATCLLLTAVSTLAAPAMAQNRPATQNQGVDRAPERAERAPERGKHPVPAGYAGNPIVEGWYADPEGIIFGDTYWVFPTYSDRYEKQRFFDAFSSKDLVTWEKHEVILDADDISWADRALWAPCVVEKEGKYYFFFGANDIQRPGGPYWDRENLSLTGGIGIAVADSPAGPYKDYLGKPLINDFHNGAQPIDQFVYKTSEGKHLIYYGGWGHCNVAQLNDDFTGFVPFEDGTIFKEITPEGYVEGPVMFERGGKFYFMWSQGGWTNSTYHVAYAIADSPMGPFEKIGTVLSSDENIATGAGHHSVMQVPGKDEWYIVYHRRPIPNHDGNHRVTCIDKLEFGPDGKILPVKMTWEGVKANPIEK